jgi:outer membrane protein assembly factor BamE (lipoprotein component of BamABCDE complex)
MRFAIPAALLSLVAVLSACDEQRVSKLETGVATETEVRQQFGEPVTVETLGDGSRVFEYPRQPEGTTNYFIRLGPDGKLAEIRQVLTEANFSRVTPGMAQHEVRALLGRPAKMQRLDLKQQQVWDWRYQISQSANQPTGHQQTRLFSVTFDADGRVLGSASTEENRESQAGG